MKEMKSESLILKNSNSLRQTLVKEFRIARAQKYLLMLMIPGFLITLIFRYLPIYGIILAFREWNIDSSFGDKWADPLFKYFTMLFRSKGLLKSVELTLMYSGLNIIFAFPAPIILAIFFNELKTGKFKNIVQTISYMPHFLSWVVVSGLVVSFLSPSVGVANLYFRLFNVPKEVWIAQPGPFIAIVVLSGIWKSIGWGTIVYLASIASLNQETYEAAYVDGASRFKRVIHITIPGIKHTVVYFLIFTVSGVLASNFDQLYNLMNPAVYDVADVIDVYLLRVGLNEGQYSFATAAGMVRNLIAVFLLIMANRGAKYISEYTLW